MIERILKHMNIYREMKNAAIPLNLIGKKGEDSCMNAARLVNQQELSSLMEGLNEETISSLMDDPEILSYLGKMNKKDFSILEPDRIRMVIECAGNEKLSEFPYKKIEKVLADKEIPDRIVYVYLKYYAFLEPKEELKKQLVASLETCIGEFDVARAGIKIRMLLINPAFSTELLYELLKDEESLASLLKQDLMELVNYLSEFCEETESLNKKQLEELSRHPKEIRNGLEVILTQIPKEWQASFLHLWLWNESLYADIPIRKDGTLFDGEKQVLIIRGRKLLKKQISMDICKAIVSLGAEHIYQKEWQNTYSVRALADPNLMIEILNVRALKRNKRDDNHELLDRIEGTRIVYETDQEKEIKRQKQERKKIKLVNLQRKLVTHGFEGLQDSEKRLLQKKLNAEQLEELNLQHREYVQRKHENQYQQMTLFAAENEGEDGNE